MIRARLLVFTALAAGLVSSSIDAATISGYVRDAASSESLPYVPVFIKNPRAGTMTNEHGYYAIPGLSAGAFELVCAYIGYEKYEQTINVTADEDAIVNINLGEEAIELAVLAISADRDDAETYDISPGRLTLRGTELKSAGHVMLEADPIRTVQTLPGVLSLSDFSVGLYVRGGAPDENLVLLDGTDVYNASHLFGLFSTFPADAAKSTELLRGGFPAKYGARLSSVLNVITDEGNKNQYEGIGGVSLLSSRLTLQGPVGRGSWLASGRRTYLEPILKLANLDTVFGYSFYDLQGKTHQVFSQDDQLTVAAYAGRDHFQVTPDGFDVDLWWGNKTFSAQWTHIFNPRWFSHFVVTGSDFDSKATIEVEGLRFEQTNDLTDWSFKGDLNWFPTQDHAAEIGWNVKWFTLNFHNRIQGNDFGSVNQDVLHIAGYVQDTWKVTNMFTLQPGFRASHFTEGGYNRFDPRLAGRYQFTTDTFFKAAWGIYHQPIFRVPREFQGITFLSDIWFMADTTAGPTKATHWVAGIEHNVGDAWSIEWEAYFKDYDEVTAFNYNVDADALTSGGFLLRGVGQAYGTDIQIKKSTGRHTGWISFSQGWTVRRFPQVNDDKGKIDPQNFYPKYDRRQSMNTVYQWHWGKDGRGTLNARYSLASGQPYTETVGVGNIFDDFGNQAPIIHRGPLNQKRLPMYQRLDMGLSYNFKFKRWSLKPYLQVVNVLDQENIFNRTPDLFGEPWREDEAARAGGIDELKMLPIFPSIGVDFEF